MSEITRGAIGMPFEMAMESELSRRQFHSIAQALLVERDQLKSENEALRKERDARHPFKPFHEPAIGFTGCVICGVYTDHGGLPCPKTRATADAATGKGEQS